MSRLLNIVAGDLSVAAIAGAASTISAADADDYFGATALGAIFADLHVPVAVTLQSPEGPRFVAVSQGFLEHLDLSRAEIQDRLVRDVFLTEASLALNGAIDRAMLGRDAVQATVGGLRPAGGAARWRVRVRPGPAACPGSAVLELSGPAEAVAPRGRAAMFDQLALLGGGVVYVFDLARGRAFDIKNDPGNMLGYAADDPLFESPLTMHALIHPDDMDGLWAHRAALATLADGEFATNILRMRHADGTWRWIEGRERVLTRGRKGEPRRVLGFACDISERRRLMDALAGASKALLIAEQEERRRIARELHDSTAQHLVAIDLTLSRLERRSDADPEVASILEDIRTSLAAAHREIRTFSYLLHPPNLERAGLVDALRQFLEGFRQRVSLEVSFEVEGPARRMPPLRELALYRIAQEALMNVHKHAAARRVAVRLVLGRESAALEVLDDGVGLTVANIRQLLAEDTGGVGIAGMKARMIELGGVLEVVARPRGLLVRATIPTWTGDGVGRALLGEGDRD